MMLPRVLLDVPITFDVGDELTHAPMVHATVGDAPTKLIVDTGSSDHILTVELAERVGLALEPGEPGIDSTGAAVPSWTLGEISIRIEDHGFALHDVVAIEGPPPFGGWGIGGILSPQSLHPNAWAVLDLVDDRFFLLDGDDADVLAWLATRSPDLNLVRIEHEPTDGTILVRAAIEPYEPTVTLLDTGGKRTRFTTTAFPGEVDGQLRSSAGRGVGGKASLGAEARDRTLLVGGARVALDSILVGDGMDGRDGLVGMDMLRGTVLTVTHDANRSIFWQIDRARIRDSG